VEGRQEIESVGARVAARRRELGLTQRHLAQHGMSHAYVSRIEAGTRRPSVRALRKLAPLLQTTVHWLETGEPDPGEALAEIVLAHEDALPAQASKIARQILNR
jgi:transcriptional regulator with XRE-family HTH domain